MKFIFSTNSLSNKLFQCSYKILNAPNEKIMFLLNFCYLFPMLFYDWNASIHDSFRFFGDFFLGISSWYGASLFNGWLLLSWGTPHGGISKKIIGWGKALTPPPPTPLPLFPLLNLQTVCKESDFSVNSNNIKIFYTQTLSHLLKITKFLVKILSLNS